MSEPAKRKKRKNTHFWRACRYLIPYRRLVAASIVAALFVGLAMTGGLGTMLPIMRILINGDTVQGWMYRMTAEQRLGINLQSDPDRVQIIQIASDGPASNSALAIGDTLDDASSPAQYHRDPFFDLSKPVQRAGETMRKIAWADGDVIALQSRGRTINLHPHPMPALLSGRGYLKLGMIAVEFLPVRPVQSVAAIFGILALLGIVGNVIRFFQEYLSDKAAILAVNDIRRRLYDRVLQIPMSFFGQQGTSDVTSRLVSDAANLQDGFKTVLGQSIQEPIKAVMALGLALTLSWKLTLFIIAFGPIMGIILKKFGKKMRRASRAAMQSSSTMLGQVEGTLIGIRVVKAAGAERFERRRYMRIMGSLLGEQLRMSRIDAISAPTLESLTMLVAGVVVIYASFMVLVEGTLSPEKFILIMISLAMIGESLRRFSKVNNALQKANAAAARIFETLDLPVERPRGKERFGQPPLKALPNIAREIRFEDIRFRYPNSPTLALDGITLTVPKGQSVAVVGRNGSGKTTLLGLLPRFYHPETGRITIDGADIRTATLASLRRQISIVTQDSVIFPGTIAQNIAYGNPQADPQFAATETGKQLRKDIEDAARRAFAHEFVLEKPHGYDTVLGEMGGQLSGGQKQRLCIARAILRKSPILILDEATSQVDAESEHLIQQAIETLMHERTTFVIAHRFSTILSADTIVVMERGKIVGQGKHDQLLSTCPTYQQLYERQLVGSVG